MTQTFPNMPQEYPLFIETVRWSDGHYHLTELHRQRLDRTRREVFGPTGETLPPDWLPPVPDEMKDLTVKCRVKYDTTIRTVEFEPYRPKKVSSLKLVDGGGIDYHLKYNDRTALSELAKMRGDADDVIIIKDGLITDTSYSNLVFATENGQFLTPDRPLLRGVMLSHLTTAGKVIPARLRPEDLRPGNRYGIRCAFMINAMIPLGSTPPINICNIY